MTVPWRITAQPAIATQEHDVLPQPLTRLVGRERDTAIVADFLGRPDVRLLTLTGPGGIGKTRLALHAATGQADAFPDGVFFAALAPLVDPNLVLPTIARAVGVPSAGTRPVGERLSLALGYRRMLVVLDNFEQVAAAATPLTAVLAACPGVRFLVTSRVSLRISGEHEFAVPPLDLPPADDATLADLQRNPAITLFAHRAGAVDAGFELTDANIRTVAEICRRLGGVPLAIELAATRVKALPPGDILARLSTSLDVLSGGPRDQPARLRSMRATIAWSYDLLPPRQQAMLRWLSIFAGGCPLDVAEAMAPHAGDDAGDESEPALDVISALIDASLVWREAGFDGRPRISMLETIRQFALEKMEASDDRAAAQGWLVRWCVGLADRAYVAARGRRANAWYSCLQQERDNFRAALAYLETRGDRETLLRLATSLAPMWSALGNEREGYRWLAGALANDAGVSAAVRIRALPVVIRLANALGNHRQAEAFAVQGEALALELDDDRGIADMRCALGNISRGLGDGGTAGLHYEDALARYRALGDQYEIGYTLVQLAKLGELGSVLHRGDVTDLARAMARGEEALRIYRDLENSWGIARALHQLGHLAYKNREFARAVRLSSDALEMFCRHGNLAEAANPLEDLADVAGATGHGEIAARLYGVAEVLRERLGVPMWPSYRPEYEQEVALARATVEDDRFDREWQAGRALDMAKAITEARAFVDALASTPGIESADRSIVSPAAIHGLTARELDVLRLLATGSANRAIADELFISVTTVKGHVRSIMDKLDLRSRTALAAWAHQHDLA